MISVENLAFRYTVNRCVLEDIHFDVSTGQCISILGNNGAGKSTLLKCMNKIITPQGGSVIVEHQDVLTMKRQNIAKHLAYVAQKNDPGQYTVYDAVLLGRKPYIKLSPTLEDYKIVEETIAQLGLSSYLLRKLDELSGGELQKVMIARALAQKPKVLLLDEPTSSLDLKNQLEVLSLVSEITRTEKIAVIIVIHDLNLALRYCDRFLMLKNNRIDSYGDMQIITPENIERVYGVQVEVQKYGNRKFIIPVG